jgi:kynureninase
MEFKPHQDYALTLDQTDSLAGFRSRFVIQNPGLIYLDGNSLGRLPLVTAEQLQTVVRQEWGTDLINGWNKHWWEAPVRVGEKIAPLVGAGPGQVIVSDSTSVNLFKLATAALRLRPGPTRIVTDKLNFPSDLYILQGIVDLLGNRHEIVRIGSLDSDVTPNLDELEAAIDEQTALVTLSHVVFKSGYLYDMARITEKAHQVGALVLWDLSHSVGALPIALDECQVDFAIGCTYKYLNGGPGAPAFLYINRRLQEQARSPIWGWVGQDQPFAFGLDYVPAPGMTRFQAGTPSMLALSALEASLEPLLEAGLQAIRRKSVLLTEYAIYLYDQLLSPLGFSLGSPRNSERRGSHVSLRHPEGYRINRVLIDEMQVLPDFREPDNIRLGFAPLYTSFSEVREAFERLSVVVTEKRYEQIASERLTVT